MSHRDFLSLNLYILIPDKVFSTAFAYNSHSAHFHVLHFKMKYWYWWSCEVVFLCCKENNSLTRCLDQTDKISKPNKHFVGLCTYQNAMNIYKHSKLKYKTLKT